MDGWGGGVDGMPEVTVLLHSFSPGEHASQPKIPPYAHIGNQSRDRSSSAPDDDVVTLAVSWPFNPITTSDTRRLSKALDRPG